jgi:hypothetical protein
MEFALTAIWLMTPTGTGSWKESADGYVSSGAGGQVMSLSDDEKQALESLERRLLAGSLEYQRLARLLARREALRFAGELGVFVAGAALLVAGLLVWWPAAVGGELLVAGGTLSLAYRQRAWLRRRRPRRRRGER